jgi:hypothetical protein
VGGYPIILAQDPSFAKLAFSLYDGKSTIYIQNCTFSLGECVGFEKVFHASKDILSQYTTRLESLGVNKTLFIDKIFSEIPPPNGTYAAGLFALDTYILDHLWSYLPSCSEIWTLPPSFLMTLHNTRKYKKSESVTLAKYFMNDILKGRFTYKYTGILNADRAESFLFLVKAFCKYNIQECRESIIKAISGYFSESENLLIKRE